MEYTDTQLREMVEEIDESGVDLKGWDLDFISDLMDRNVQVFSNDQATQIERIYEENL